MNRLDQLIKMLEEDPTNSFLCFAIAKEYENSEDYSNATKFYNKIRETDPDYIGVYYHSGKLYEMVEDFDNALNSYQMGITKAQLSNDLHALSELKAALLNLEISRL